MVLLWLIGLNYRTGRDRFAKEKLWETIDSWPILHRREEKSRCLTG